jgi:hypothetical protein
MTDEELKRGLKSLIQDKADAEILLAAVDRIDELKAELERRQLEAGRGEQ